MSLAGLGIAIGIIGSLGLMRFLSSLLFATAPLDPPTMIVTAAVLSGVALLACWLPARRAARVDPVMALRYE